MNSKKIIESFKAIPGVGAKSAEAFYKAGFKTPKSITSAKDEVLLAVPHQKDHRWRIGYLL